VLLGGVIAIPEVAEDAWTVLKEVDRELARDRQGPTIRDWADRLSRRNIQFACDADDTPAARIEATRRVLRTYRDSCVGNGTDRSIERLGHSSPHVTATVYSHAIKGRDKRSSAKLGRVSTSGSRSVGK
jgi:hypothetical protein